MVSNWTPIELSSAMPNDKVPLRIPPILHAYLNDLADLGTYGKGKNGVVRRFIEDGIRRAIEAGVIQKRSVKDFPDGD